MEPNKKEKTESEREMEAVYNAVFQAALNVEMEDVETLCSDSDYSDRLPDPLHFAIVKWKGGEGD